MSKIEERLAAAGFELPEVPAPLASYVPAIQTQVLIFTSGQIPRKDGQVLSPGRVGDDVDQESARLAARQAALQSIAAVSGMVSDLDKVSRVVKVTVFVRSAPGFSAQPFVADGASEIFSMAFGDAGQHARSAVGVAELPLGSCVEVEIVVEVTP